jgi:hypothetical protein
MEILYVQLNDNVIHRPNWLETRRYENKTLIRFQLIVTLDKVIYINRNILLVVTQLQFTKQNRFTFRQKNSH